MSEWWTRYLRSRKLLWDKIDAKDLEFGFVSVVALFLEDEREFAIEQLADLRPSMLEGHLEFLVDHLSDDESEKQLLSKFDDSVLMPHLYTILGRLDHDEEIVRCNASELLQKFDRAVLMPHIGHIEYCLNSHANSNSHQYVLDVALQLRAHCGLVEESESVHSCESAPAAPREAGQNNSDGSMESCHSWASAPAAPGEDGHNDSDDSMESWHSWASAPAPSGVSRCFGPATVFMTPEHKQIRAGDFPRNGGGLRVIGSEGQPVRVLNSLQHAEQQRDMVKLTFESQANALVVQAPAGRLREVKPVTFEVTSDHRLQVKGPSGQPVSWTADEIYNEIQRGGHPHIYNGSIFCQVSKAEKSQELRRVIEITFEEDQAVLAWQHPRTRPTSCKFDFAVASFGSEGVASSHAHSHRAPRRRARASRKRCSATSSAVNMSALLVHEKSSLNDDSCGHMSSMSTTPSVRSGDYNVFSANLPAPWLPWRVSVRNTFIEVQPWSQLNTGPYRCQSMPTLLPKVSDEPCARGADSEVDCSVIS